MPEKQPFANANRKPFEAGAQLMNWFSVGCELHRDWRNDIEGFGGTLASHLPHYANLMQSFTARTG